MPKKITLEEADKKLDDLLDDNLKEVKGISYTAEPTIGFPHVTRWLKRPIGWNDLGEVFETEDGIPAFHLLCGKNLHICKEKASLYLFCPHCMVKVE